MHTAASPVASRANLLRGYLALTVLLAVLVLVQAWMAGRSDRLFGDLDIVLHGIDWEILIPLVIGSVPGTILGSVLAPRVPQSFIRRGIVVVLTMSGVALLDKSGWAPLGVEETHPMLIAGVGLAVLLVLPIVWGFLRLMSGRHTVEGLVTMAVGALGIAKADTIASLLGVA